METLLKRYPGSYTYSSALREVADVLLHMQIIDIWTGEVDPPPEPADLAREAKADRERELFG